MTAKKTSKKDITQTECPRRMWLLKELQVRQTRNSSYSLRAFARFLGISCATLSKILAGKRRVSLAIAEKIAARCSFSPQERQKFFSASEKNSNARSENIVLDTDQFAMISDWYHYAILSLARIEKNSASHEWIALQLGIKKREARAALERLVRMGFLQIKNGKMYRIEKFLRTGEGANIALRKYHTQNLNKAAYSIMNDSVESRHVTSLTFAVDPLSLDDFIAEIKHLYERCSVQSDQHKPKQVYTLATQLFPVSKYPQGDKL